MNEIIFLLFLAVKKVTEITGAIVLRVSMFDDYPIGVQPYIDIVNAMTTELESIRSDLIAGQYEEVVLAKNL